MTFLLLNIHAPFSINTIQTFSFLHSFLSFVGNGSCCGKEYCGWFVWVCWTVLIMGLFNSTSIIPENHTFPSKLWRNFSSRWEKENSLHSVCVYFCYANSCSPDVHLNLGITLFNASSTGKDKHTQEQIIWHNLGIYLCSKVLEPHSRAPLHRS